MTGPPELAGIDRPWIAAYPPGVPPTYRIPPVGLPRLLDDAVRDFPSAIALTDGATSLTHVALRDRVAEVVAVLRARGVTAGTRVLVASGTTATTTVVLLALWRVGAVAVPLPPGRDPERTAARAVEVAQATEVQGALCTPDHRRQLLDAGLEVDWILDTGDTGWLDPRRVRRLPGPLRRPGRRRRRGPDGATRLGQAVAEVADQPVTVHAAGPVPADAPALLVPRWRGGQRRIIVLTHRNLVASTFQARLWVPDIQAGRERVVVAGDLLGLGPMVLGWLAGLLAAATVELVAPEEAAGLARRIARQHATIAVLEPAQVTALLDGSDASRRDLSSLRVVLASGAPLDTEVVLELERRSGGARVREGFGVSEAGPITHAQPVYGRTTRGAMGLPVTDTVAVVVDPDDLGRLRAPGEPGLLLLAGPQVSPGYLDDEVADAERFIDGWLVTDDLVTVDEHGVFTHLGRRDEVLTGADGEPVSPRRVESVLERHPGVRRAGVTTDLDTGALVAAVTTSRRGRPEPEELLAHCQAHLDSRLRPERVTLVDEIPEDDAGGVARALLRTVLAER